MSEVDALTRRLEKMLAKTAHAKNFDPPAWWEGDRAGEKQVYDNLAAGRVQMESAHSAAKLGLKELSAGKLSEARVMAWAAMDFYVEALEKRASRIRSDLKKSVDQPAKRRGRPPGSPNKKGREAPTK